MSASAGLVALCALVVSAYQTKIMREQQKMSAWPAVYLGNTGGDSSYAYLVSNTGVGPARVRSATLTVHGRPLTSWGDVFQVALGADGARLDSLLVHAWITTSSVHRGRVLLPGATSELIRIDGPLGRPLRRFLNDSATHLRVCYCSVYTDCWVAESQAEEPTPVPDCTTERTQQFRS